MLEGMEYLSHPAKKKAELRLLLTTCQVVTIHQLRRLGLERAAQWLQLPRATYSCRTRATQQDSTRNLEFVALEAAVLQAAPRDLMHLAGTAEAYIWHRYGAGQETGAHRWSLVELAGRSRDRLPDAEILRRPGRGNDSAVEFDAGYLPEKAELKAQAFASQGYSHLLWATTVQGRVKSLAEEFSLLHSLGRLPNIRRVDVIWANIWEDAPYRVRPRCRKAVHVSRVFV